MKTFTKKQLSVIVFTFIVSASCIYTAIISAVRHNWKLTILEAALAVINILIGIWDVKRFKKA